MGDGAPAGMDCTWPLESPGPLLVRHPGRCWGCLEGRFWGGGEVNCHPVLLLPLARPGVLRVDILVELGEDGLAVFEGAQEGGDVTEPVLHDPAILHQLCLGEDDPPEAGEAAAT